MNASVRIIECPRDAMQGIVRIIPTSLKVEYINALLKVGFDTIDFGSFVSAKAIPQMADTPQVLEGLDLTNSTSKLLAIVANKRGAEEAVRYKAITYLGFPLSISETFQMRNTNKSISEALNTLEQIRNECDKNGKKLVTYISMGFGNPYGDPYEADLVSQFVGILRTLGADVISLADTVGIAEPSAIESLFTSVTKEFPGVDIGAHLHATPESAAAKTEAAWRGGCRRFDGALRGFGGCPMAKDELVGNIATESIVTVLESKGELVGLDTSSLVHALQVADRVFSVQ